MNGKLLQQRMPACYRKPDRVMNENSALNIIPR